MESTVITPQPSEPADPIGDEELWAILRRVATELAPSFRDVSTADDILGDLALLAHERWMPEWFDRQDRPPLPYLLRDRMRDRLREERRRLVRRANLIRHAPIVSAFPAPDEPLAAEELREQAAQGSPELRRLLTMREAGLDQTEIARRTHASPATISRRFALIAAALAALATVAMLIVWALPDDPPAPSLPAARLIPEPPVVAPAAPPAPRPAAPAPEVTPDPSPVPEGPAPDVRPAAPKVRGSLARTLRGFRRARGGPVPPPPPGASTSFGGLMINALPWARVTLDGRDVGNTPLLLQRVTPGRHVVTFRTSAGVTRSIAVNVEAGQTERVTARIQ